MSGPTWNRGPYLETARLRETRVIESSPVDLELGHVPGPLLGDVTLTLSPPLPRSRQSTWRYLPYPQALLGRASGSWLPVDEPWMPRVLVELEHAEHGWLLRAGTGVTVRVSGPRVRANLLPSGRQLLDAGSWAVTFPTLDHPCRLDVRVYRADHRLRYQQPDARRAPRLDLDQLCAADRPRPKCTAAAHVGLTGITRHRLAVLYRYLLEDDPAPGNLCAAAGRELDLEEDAVRRLAYRIRDRLNEKRTNPLRTLEELGEFLVFTAQVVNPDHLQRPHEER